MPQLKHGRSLFGCFLLLMSFMVECASLNLQYIEYFWCASRYFEEPVFAFVFHTLFFVLAEAVEAGTGSGGWLPVMQT